ncbi:MULTISPECIES: DUF6575 domain-containing protein [Aeromonas]|uniref:DUF6575 domain-containing protein n=1 Tax=Aeromonas TaxID=642 RepID=UPI0031FDEA5A
MSILPKKTCLGSLYISEIYEYYDGPKLFCARNKTNQAYVSYWCDSSSDNEYDGWLYIPVSEKRLEQVRRGEISIKEAFEKHEDVIYLAYVFYTGKQKDTVELKELPKLLDDGFIPEDEFFVEQDSIEFISKNEVDWNHDVRIARDSRNTNPSAESVSAIIGTWTILFESAMNFLSKSQKLYPAYAVPGSFEVKFNTSNNEVASEVLYKVTSIFNDSTLKDEALSQRLYNIGVQVSDLKEFFDSMDYYGVEIDVSPKIFSGDIKPCYLRRDDVTRWRERLENIYGCVLGTNKIPQADELINVIKILQLRADSKEFSQESFGLVDRQIRYYKDAAVLLGYLTKNSALTSQGRYLLEHQDLEDRMRLIASSFKATDCALAWKKWSNEPDITKLDPNSAADFILENVPGFSESTARRRAKTLTKWYSDLQKYF